MISALSWGPPFLEPKNITNQQFYKAIRKRLYKKTDVVFCFFGGSPNFLIYIIYISRVSLHTHQVCWDNLFLQEDGVQEHHPGQQSQIVLCPEEAQEDERVEEGEVVDNEGEEGEEDEEDKEKKGWTVKKNTSSCLQETSCDQGGRSIS